jgi:hypothetical protein
VDSPAKVETPPKEKQTEVNSRKTTPTKQPANTVPKPESEEEPRTSTE